MYPWYDKYVLTWYVTRCGVGGRRPATETPDTDVEEPANLSLGKNESECRKKWNWTQISNIVADEIVKMKVELRVSKLNWSGKKVILAITWESKSKSKGEFIQRRVWWELRSITCWLLLWSFPAQCLAYHQPGLFNIKERLQYQIQI